MARRPEDAGWSQGVDIAYLKELVAYWADGFDWPDQEASLNRLPRYRTALNGAGVHFAHVRADARAGAALPLILCHGWPCSVWRYAKVIPLLTDPGAHGADPGAALDVVVPDMPGCGYSDRPVGAPVNTIAVAGMWAELMSRLGYDRFGAAGGDMGSGVSRCLSSTTPTASWRCTAWTPASRCTSATAPTSPPTSATISTVARVLPSLPGLTEDPRLVRAAGAVAHLTGSAAWRPPHRQFTGSSGPPARVPRRRACIVGSGVATAAPQSRQERQP